MMSTVEGFKRHVAQVFRRRFKRFRSCVYMSREAQGERIEEVMSGSPAFSQNGVVEVNLTHSMQCLS